MKYYGVKNLEKYQHYKDRDPKWVKLYYSILDDEAFIFLSEIDRCRYMTCLVLASRTNNKIPADPIYLRKVMRLDKNPDLTPLLSCGLLYTCYSSSTCLDNDYTNAPVPNGSLLSSTLLNSSLSSPKSGSESEEGKESEKGESATDFEIFWKAYPKRVGGKKNALRAWERAQDRPALDEILAVLERCKQTEQWKKDGGQFIPYPATWINKGMWADDVTVLDSAFKRSMNNFLERHKEEA